jgi:hypothetical protein
VEKQKSVAGWNSDHHHHQPMKMEGKDCRMSWQQLLKLTLEVLGEQMARLMLVVSGEQMAWLLSL